VLKNNYLKIIVLQKMERDPQIIRGYKWHVNKNWKVKVQFGGRVFLYKEPGLT